MSPFVLALMTGAGVGGWAYYQSSKRMPGNMQAIVICTVAAGLVGAFVIYSLFAWVFPE